MLTGCYAQLEPEIGKSLGRGVTVVSNDKKADIPEVILSMFGIRSKDSQAVKLISRMNGHSRAFIKIQEGCREKCSYCVIWKVRGRPQSREPRDIIDEINALYENGYREVVLTGVHIGRYKKHLNLTELLEEIMKSTDIPRIRLSSLKPNEFKDELIQLLADQPRICSHVHLPIQSGDDEILKAMGRKYKAASISALTNRLVEARPDITIGADIIVGFPGETESHFENTVELVKDSPIHHLHVFSYSDRPGTEASLMPDKVAPEDKARRSERLRRIGVKKKRAHAERFVEKTLDIIVEDRKRSGRLTGISGNYLRVEFDGDESLRRKHIKIRISLSEKDTLIGDPTSIAIIKKG